MKFEIVKGRHHQRVVSPAACEGDEAFEERYQKMVGRFGFQLTKAQEAQFYSDIGREERIALSEPDQAFFRRIDTFSGRGYDLETRSHEVIFAVRRGDLDVGLHAEELEAYLREAEGAEARLPAEWKARYFEYYDDVKDKSLKKQDW